LTNLPLTLGALGEGPAAGGADAGRINNSMRPSSAL